MDDNGIQPDCFTAARRWSSNASVIRGSQPKTSLSGIFLRSTLLFIAFANIIPWDFHLSTRSKKCIENFYQNLFVLTTAFFIFFTAYSKEMDKASLQKFWGTYFQTEKEIYEKLLENPDEEVKGTVKELAEKYGINVFTMTGFLDGINDSLKVANPIETMDEDTEVSLAFDKELLYKNMVDAKADWLYELPQWDKIFTEEKKKVLYKEQKNARTIHVEKKVYPNDPCPCGSGKK